VLHDRGYDNGVEVLRDVVGVAPIFIVLFIAFLVRVTGCYSFRVMVHEVLSSNMVRWVRVVVSEPRFVLQQWRIADESFPDTIHALIADDVKRWQLR
jgi:hypothetical protein